MSESRLICIVGPDGAGKSTQAELLQEELESRGHDCKYQWLRFNHMLSLPLLGIARLLGLSEMEELESGRKVGYHYFWQSRVLSYIYPITLFLDTLIMYVSKILWPLESSDQVLICDRFIHDTLVGLMISTGRKSLHTSFTGRLFLKLIPSKTTTIVLNADAEVLRNRRDDVRADKTIQEKIDRYNELANYLELPVLDAANSPEDIQKKIQKLAKPDY
ncbi:hypothetical protein [Haloarcula onubensis]|uniref:Thymidylate kinase n=1 Tax=Haloarcula onubensis TaxID=2950539 RepID=A0ABU2FJ49_9EURY|nr:hypothetical protein [Halomicroarcula sp. S3CR25-11]MDS0280786.1 hypothetical protein [Halomicroarcula sp. S3CR25-11]